MSVTQQKSDLRRIIHRKVEQHLTEHPEAAHATAMGAIRRLSGGMTLAELEAWHTALFVEMPGQEPQP